MLRRQHRFTRLTGMLIIPLVLMMASACSHAPTTISLETPEGKQEVKAPLPVTLFAMARLLESQGRLEKSEALLRQIMIRYPDCLPSYNELANILARQRRFGESLSVIHYGLKQAPADGVLLNNAGMCHLLQKDYDQAAKYFQKACQANPGDKRSQGNYALALALQGKIQMAQTIYESFLTAEETRQNLQIIQKTRPAEAPVQTANKDVKEKSSIPLPPVQ